MPGPETIAFQRGAARFEATLGDVLAEGGGAIVDRARRTDDGGEIVVKRARPGKESLLALEQQVGEKVDHPNLVRYLGAGRSREHGLVLAFERLGTNPLLLLNGTNRRPRFFDPRNAYYPLPPGRALELAFDLVSGLEHLHASGFVHADVKLANLLVRTPGASDANGVLSTVADGDFEGVLIDLGSVRASDQLAALSRGEEGQPPEVTPLYAPPEALVELSAFGGRLHYSPAMDVYASGLVLYSLLTGRVPYDHLCAHEKLKDVDFVLDLKTREARRELSPIDKTALDAIPLHDVAFEGSAQTGWPRFRAGAARFLDLSVDPDARHRTTAAGARGFLVHVLGLTAVAQPGAPRAWVQRLFQMRPRANRLSNESKGSVRIREAADGRLVVEEGVARVARPTGDVTQSIDVEDATIAIRKEREKGRTSRLYGKLPPPPKGTCYLADVLREFRAQRPLPITPPVLITRSGLGPRDLVQCLVYSLGSTVQGMRIDANDTVAEKVRVTVGRTGVNDLVVSETTVSKTHLAFERQASHWHAVDLGSANGSTLDDVPLQPNVPKRLLRDYAVIGLGPTAKLTYLDGPELTSYLERALDAWTQAYGHREKKSETAQIRSARLRTLLEEHVGTGDPAVEKTRQSAATQRIKRPADLAPAPVPAPAAAEDSKRLIEELAPRMGPLAGKGTFWVFLEDARVETTDELDDALEVLRDAASDVLKVEFDDAKTRVRTVLFDRER